MLSVHHLTKSFGIETVFRDVSFTLNPGDRLGLVGPNGAGKTTLLRILTRQINPDSGLVIFNPPSLRLGYLPQGYQFPGDETIESFITRMEGDLAALEDRLMSLAAALGDDPDLPGLLEAYDSTLAQLNAAAGLTRRSPEVLAALGLADFPLDTPVQHLSGGQKTRLALAGVLLSAPDLLLLDEPTNHLDIEMLEWLEDWLLEDHGALLLVSHDRALLDKVATAILELDPLTRTARMYPGNYAGYLEQKLDEREKQTQQYADQQAEIRRLRAAAARVRGQAQFHRGGKADTGDKFARGFFANRGLETMQRARNIERRIERLLTTGRVEKPGRTWQMKVEFAGTPETGRDALVLDDLSVGYENTALLEHLNLTLRYGRRAALVGPNGAGKTTLLRTIAGLIPPLAGAVRPGSRVRMGYMAQEQENLDPHKNALELLSEMLSQNETEVRSFLSKFLFKQDDVFTPAGKLSYGERARLSLALLAAGGCSLLLLDEPVNHLDIPSRVRFEQALAGYEGAVLAVAHDRYFIASFATELWVVHGKSLRQELRES